MKQTPPKRKTAAALKFPPPSDQALHMTAKGRDVGADALIRRAQEAGISIRKNRDLLQLDLDKETPEALYQTVTQILTFVCQVHNEYQPGLAKP